MGMKMKALRILVRGRVQKVGYRRLVDEAAFDLGVTGYVKNLDDKKTVEIFAEHEDIAIIRRFVEKIKIVEYPIRVEQVETKEVQPVGYSGFEVIEGPLEIENRESIEAGAIYMRKLATEMKMTREELSNKMDEGFTKLGDKMDTLGDKMDTLGNKMDTLSNKMDTLSNKMDEGFTKLGDKMDNGFTKLGDKLDKFSNNTSKRFDVMEQKYGTVSENLDKIARDLHELVEILKMFKPKISKSASE